jgi:hypothetical protein
MKNIKKYSKSYKNNSIKSYTVLVLVLIGVIGFSSLHFKEGLCNSTCSNCKNYGFLENDPCSIESCYDCTNIPKTNYITKLYNILYPKNVLKSKTNNTSVNNPAVNNPTVNNPAVNTPTVNNPTVNNPAVNTPTVNNPTVNTPDESNTDPDVTDTNEKTSTSTSTVPFYVLLFIVITLLIIIGYLIKSYLYI